MNVYNIVRTISHANYKRTTVSRQWNGTSLRC